MKLKISKINSHYFGVYFDFIWFIDVYLHRYYIVITRFGDYSSETCSNQSKPSRITRTVKIQTRDKNLKEA